MPAKGGFYTATIICSIAIHSLAQRSCPKLESTTSDSLLSLVTYSLFTLLASSATNIANNGSLLWCQSGIVVCIDFCVYDCIPHYVMNSTQIIGFSDSQKLADTQFTSDYEHGIHSHSNDTSLNFIHNSTILSNLQLQPTREDSSYSESMAAFYFEQAQREPSFSESGTAATAESLTSLYARVLNYEDLRPQPGGDREKMQDICGHALTASECLGILQTIADSNGSRFQLSVIIALASIIFVPWLICAGAIQMNNMPFHGVTDVEHVITSVSSTSTIGRTCRKIISSNWWIFLWFCFWSWFVQWRTQIWWQCRIWLMWAVTFSRQCRFVGRDEQEST